MCHLNKLKKHQTIISDKNKSNATVSPLLIKEDRQAEIMEEEAEEGEIGDELEEGELDEDAEPELNPESNTRELLILLLKFNAAMVDESSHR